MSIVVTSGGFDPLHVGHIAYLQKAAKWNANKHICIVNSDKFLDSKKGYHVMNWVDRITIVGALKYVDEVWPAIDEDQTVCKTLELVRVRYPDDTIFFLKGGDRKKEEIPEAEVCNRLGIQIIDGMGDKIRSSSDIIQEAAHECSRDTEKGVL